MQKVPGDHSKVGLVLGAGAARGFAHLGVLQVLQDEGLPVDLVVGSSVGSIFGALYCCGADLGLLEKLAGEIRQGHLVDLKVGRMGFIQGRKLEALMRLLTKNCCFYELKTPLYVVAVDIERGEKVVITEGSVAEAIRASTAIPGLFFPKRHQGRLLVDGAVLDRLPTRVAREQGAEVVIAVDVKFGSESHYHPVHSFLEVMIQALDLLEREVAKMSFADADVVIQPNLGHVGGADFGRAKECIEAGRQAAREVLPQLKAVCSSRRS